LHGEAEFDLVVTDQQMPVMTGIELCQQMRACERFADTPVIMLTAKGLELELSQLRRDLGISQVLPKPFSPHGLVEAIQELLSATVS
jgi:CheY-like chemotaxis protein